MKDLYEVLRHKEQEYKRLGKEIEALRITAALLVEEQTEAAEAVKAANNGPRVATTPVETVTPRNGTEVASARWP